MIPREENVAHAQTDLARAAVIFMLETVELRHRKDGEDEQDRLKDAHDLRVAETLLAVDDVGTDSAEGGDVRHHGVAEKGAAVKRVVVFADEECPADEPREEDDEDAIDGDEREIPRDRECPAAHEGEDGVDDDDVQAQDASDEVIGDHAAPIEKVTDDEGREEVGK